MTLISVTLIFQFLAPKDALQPEAVKILVQAYSNTNPIQPW